MNTLKINQPPNEDKKFEESVWEQKLLKEISEWKKKRMDDQVAYEKILQSIHRSFLSDKNN